VERINQYAVVLVGSEVSLLQAIAKKEDGEKERKKQQ